MGRLVLVVPVANEVELVAGFVEHHRTLGVAHQVLVDLDSADGTTDVLRELARDDDVTVLHNGTSDPNGGLDLNRVPLRHAANRLGADVVLRLDADERLLVHGGDVAAWAPSGRAVVAVPRVNAVFAAPAQVRGLLRPGRALGRVPVAASQRPLAREERLAPDAVPWVLTPIAWRVAAPADPALVSTNGGHDVWFQAPGLGTSRQPDPPRLGATGALAAVVVHLPFTTWERFARKVDRVAGLVDGLAARHGGDAGWHWRRWVVLREQGLLREEFERQFLAPDAAAAVLGQPAVVPADDLLAALAAG